METKSHFNARIMGCDRLNNVQCYRFEDVETRELGTVPCWCLDNFVLFEDALLDQEGHLRIGAEVQLRRMEGGKFYPGTIYKKRDVPAKPKQSKFMTKEALYDGILSYDGIQVDISTLWEQFIKRYGDSADVLVEGLKVRNEPVEEQREFLKSQLGKDCAKLPIQEGANVEFKSSFIHTAATVKNNERLLQYRNIFAEIAAFANSHVEACIYVGISNDGSIRGVEDELLNEVPFATRADFEADFINQLHMASHNNMLVSSISLRWYKTDDNHIFCVIGIPKWEGEIILLNGTELYVRGTASKRQLKDNDLIRYIVSNSNH